MFAKGDRGLKTGDLVILQCCMVFGFFGSDHFFWICMQVTSSYYQWKPPWWRGKKQLNSHQSSVAKVSFVSIFANFSDLHSKILHISYYFKSNVSSKCITKCATWIGIFNWSVIPVVCICLIQLCTTKKWQKLPRSKDETPAAEPTGGHCFEYVH